MTITLPNQWIWDSWYAKDGDIWHGYFLKADKSLGDPNLRHFNVSQGHAISRDLRTWEHKGTSFAPAAEPAFDDYTTWTGSVIQDETGLWHLFYTGTRRSEQGMKQRIGHATSSDAHHWTRVGDGLALDISGPDYEEYTPGHWHDRAMRDPWVMRDPDGPGWIMYFTARRPGTAEPNAGGAIGFATSPDLMTWTLQPPVYTDGDFGQLEVPQVFRIGDYWYCLFCTAAEHFSQGYAASYPGEPVTGTHYLRATDPRGPWVVAPGPFLDGAMPCRRYAARVVETDEGWVLLGFLHDAPDGSFIGEVSDPSPVSVDADGWLHLAD